ncbi:MAG TPA: ELWxxDGT repeat protein, partial [Thermoanaerobaculia bacterium]|nr:ELWxxDGT repeat protein [Thermoanaerobaculia bacterium]
TGSNARPLGAVDGVLLFAADDGASGRELWKTDGTAAGTALLTDLEPGAGGSGPEALAVIGGQLFFSAMTSAHGSELWVSDGTAAGTFMVADIFPGAGHALAGGPPVPANSFVAIAAGKLFFAANDGSHGSELWMSDGTEAGTTLVQDIYPGTTGSGPSEPVAMGGQVYFVAADDTHGRELWKTDGTGTVLVKDVAAGAADGHSPFGFSALTALGSQLLFFAQDGTHGTELWTSDGTEAGTALLADLQPGPGSSWFGEIIGFDFRIVSGGRWYFRVYDGSPFEGREVWVSDGTPAGTHLLKEINAQTSAFDVLWNGTLWGRALADAGGALFFRGNGGSTGGELCKSDGTPAGTGVVADLWPGEGTSSVQGLTGLGGTVLFSADDNANGSELWASDGTAAGTELIADLQAPITGSPDDYPRQLVRLGSSVLFAGTGGLWKTDGTAAGTEQLYYELDIGVPAVLGSEAFFSGLVSGIDGELWKSDGTAGGTLLVRDIRPGTDSSAPDGLVVAGSLLFFSADDGSAGRELWKSDGTEDGTVVVKDIVPGAGSSILMSSSYPEGGEIALAAAGSTVFFLASDGVAGEELWKSDGTEAGTVLVKDIFPGPRSSEIRWLTGVGSQGNRVFFVADDGVHGRELWVSDGTAAGTVLVEDILPGAGSSLPAELSAHEDVLLFSAHDGAHGREPWRSDGTATGTRLVQDIAPGPRPSTPLRFTRSGSRVYFAATDAATGFELWALPVAQLTGPGFYTVTPCRAVDTRTGAPLASGVNRTFMVAGSCGIPADATAIAANLTVLTPAGGGFVVAWPAGTPLPGTSNVNFSAGQTRAASSILSLSATGLAARATLAGGGTVHLLVDVVGYFK